MVPFYVIFVISGIARNLNFNDLTQILKLGGRSRVY